MEDNEFTTCMICGKKTKQINYAHLKTHNMTSKQYKEMFPNSKMRIFSQNARNKSRELIIKMNKSQSFIENNKRKLTGKPKSESHKEALRLAKSKEDKKLRAKINGDNRRGKPQPKGTLKKNHQHVYGSKSGTRKDLGHYVRSSWEANICRVLKYLNIKYEFEEDSFLVELDSNVQSRYTPDIKLSDKRYIEIKGYWHGNGKEKFESFKKQYPNIKITLIDPVMYKKYMKKFKNKVEWE